MTRLNLTDGEATSLFWELHRMIPILQQAYMDFVANPDENKAPDFNLWEVEQKAHIDNLILVHNRLGQTIGAIAGN